VSFVGDILTGGGKITNLFYSVGKGFKGIGRGKELGKKVMSGTRRKLKRVKGTKRRKERNEERTGKIGEDGSSSGKKKR
jgi:hypothetical protein